MSRVMSIFSRVQNLKYLLIEPADLLFAGDYTYYDLLNDLPLLNRIDLKHFSAIHSLGCKLFESSYALKKLISLSITLNEFSIPSFNTII